MLRRATTAPSLALAALAATCLLSAPASAAEKLRVGKATITKNFIFTLVDVGDRLGIYKKHGLELEITAYAGAPKLIQSEVAGEVDIGVQTGVDMVYVSRGAPIKAVAAITDAPDLGIYVLPDSKRTSAADFKGARVTGSASSITGWLIMEMARRQGWPAGSVEIIPGGNPATALALMKTGDVDGGTADIGTILNMEKRHSAKLAVDFSGMVKDFYTYVLYATDKLIKERPEAVRSFVAAWFETAAWAKAHKAETVKMMHEILDIDPSILDPLYDKEMAVLLDNGHFEPKSLATLKRSFVDLKLLDREPDVTPFYTEAFLPKK
jgi:ABC-type nitrate/sulfonate/bicarbonate transport system substrate-binding protein